MESIISIRDLCKSYGEKTVLRNISMEVPRGQIIGYIGPNGAGKSTTVKIITGIIRDYEGTVLVDGMNLRDSEMQTKARVGYVPELAELYELLTPREYLTFLGRLHRLSPEETESRFLPMIDAFGLTGNLDQRMDTFSKGMRQKVLLTSGMLHNPEIIVLDEPLSGLDANAVILVKEMLQRWKGEGKTIFYCSHMMDVVEKVSDRIVLIDRGRIIADGTVDALRSEGGESLEQIFARLTRNPIGTAHE